MKVENEIKKDEKWREDGKRQRHNDIRVGTLNVISGRGNRLEMACKKLRRHEIDICILTETKLCGYHTIDSSGFSICATKVKNVNQGGVALIYQRSNRYHIESPKRYGDNVIKAMIIHGGQRTTIVGIYIPPSETDSSTINELDKAMKNEDPDKCIILGDFNMNYKTPSKKRDFEIIETLETYCMNDISKRFKCRKKKPHRWTWQQIREGKKIRAICDYIFSGKSLLWTNFVPIDIQFDTDHRLLTARLKTSRVKEYKKYVERRQKPPVTLFPSQRDKKG